MFTTEDPPRQYLDAVDFVLTRVSVAVLVFALVAVSAIGVLACAAPLVLPDVYASAANGAGYFVAFVAGGICYRLAAELHPGADGAR